LGDFERECVQKQPTHISFRTTYTDVPFKNHLRITLLGCIKKKTRESKREREEEEEMLAFLSMVDISNI